MEKVFSFEKLPETVEELRTMKGFSLSDPFYVAALTVLCLNEYPKNRENSLKMMDVLKGPSPLSVLDKQFINDRFMDGKDYLMRSYFEGAVPANNYSVSSYTVKVSDNPYSYDEKDYAVLYLKSGGADSARQVKLRHKPSTDEWFIWNFEGLLSGIKVPVKDDAWA